MAENYAVCPIDEEVVATLVAYAPTQVGFTHAKITRDLVFQSLKQIEGLKIEEYDSKHYSIQTREGMRTELSLFDPHHRLEEISVGFRGGHEALILRIMEIMAKQVGPLLLYFGSGEEPRVIEPN